MNRSISEEYGLKNISKLIPDPYNINNMIPYDVKCKYLRNLLENNMRVTELKLLYIDQLLTKSIDSFTQLYDNMQMYTYNVLHVHISNRQYESKWKVRHVKSIHHFVTLLLASCTVHAVQMLLSSVFCRSATEFNGRHL